MVFSGRHYELTARALSDCFILKTTLSNFRELMHNFPLLEIAVINMAKAKVLNRANFLYKRTMPEG